MHPTSKKRSLSPDSRNKKIHSHDAKTPAHKLSTSSGGRGLQGQRRKRMRVGRKRSSTTGCLTDCGGRSPSACLNSFTLSNRPLVFLPTPPSVAVEQVRSRERERDKEKSAVCKLQRWVGGGFE